MSVVPRLWRSHPNFFIIYAVIAVVFHLGIGVTSFAMQDRYAAPSLDLVHQVAPLEVWGALHLAVFVLLTVGAYHRFDLFGRVGLALGFVLCLSRGMLIELSAHAPGAAIFVWVPMAVQHWVQMAEPQANPLTSKE